MQYPLIRVIGSALLLAALVGCGADQMKLAPSRIRHIVLIVQENRSFDNLFHGYPGANTVAYGYADHGKKVLLHPVSLKEPYDISNGFHDFIRSYDDGKLDGFSTRAIISAQRGRRFGRFPAYGFVPAAEVGPYFQLARQYVLADRMFQSNVDQSFVAHLYLIAGQADHAVNTPNGYPWGCDAGSSARVQTLGFDRQFGPSVFPCFDFRTLADELDRHELSWRYYAPKVVSNSVWKQFFKLSAQKRLRHSAGPDFGQLWSSFDAIAHVRYGPAWATNVISPERQVLRDVRAGYLANVTWVIPDFKNSDHSGSRSDTGPSWVTSVVNAVGESKFWSSTVIFIVWDDSGGWYDHVVPPQLDFDGLGFRVPLIVVSPYAKRGFITHRQYESASLLRFAEVTFGLPALADSDRRAGNLDDCFRFDLPPRAFTPIESRRGNSFFLSEQAPSLQPPDSQ